MNLRNQMTISCRFVFVVASVHISHQRVQYGQNPAVYFRTFVLHVGFFVFKTVHVGIKSEE